MPNWCENTLEITGPDEAIASLREVATCENNAFSLQALLPTPQDLMEASTKSYARAVRTLEYGDYTASTQKLHQFKNYHWVPDSVTTSEQLIDFLEARNNSMLDENQVAQKQTLREQARTLHLLHEEYGVTDWYAWRIKFWGTKWDLVDLEIVHYGKNRLTMKFLTAWNAPLKAFTTISEMYPELTFVISYRDEFDDFHGTTTLEAGHVI
tara:strand:+ start:138 stop:767 length:630 start_codon:yes stop_codon:yes gene_type:complete